MAVSHHPSLSQLLAGVDDAPAAKNKLGGGRPCKPSKLGNIAQATLAPKPPCPSLPTAQQVSSATVQLASRDVVGSATCCKYRASFSLLFGTKKGITRLNVIGAQLDACRRESSTADSANCAVARVSAGIHSDDAACDALSCLSVALSASVYGRTFQFWSAG